MPADSFPQSVQLSPVDRPSSSPSSQTAVPSQHTDTLSSSPSSLIGVTIAAYNYAVLVVIFANGGIFSAYRYAILVPIFVQGGTFSAYRYAVLVAIFGIVVTIAAYYNAVLVVIVFAIGGTIAAHSYDGNRVTLAAYSEFVCKLRGDE